MWKFCFSMFQQKWCNMISTSDFNDLMLTHETFTFHSPNCWTMLESSNDQMMVLSHSTFFLFSCTSFITIYCATLTQTYIHRCPHLVLSWCHWKFLYVVIAVDFLNVLVFCYFYGFIVGWLLLYIIVVSLLVVILL